MILSKTSKMATLIPWLSQTVMWWPTWLVLKYFTHLRIEGLEYITESDPPIIFSSNHTSELDPIIIRVALPFLSTRSPLFYVSRENSFYSDSGFKKFFYGGMIFKMFGGLPVNVGTKDYAKSLRSHLELLKSGNSLCIFPEGGITRDGILKEFKGGVSYLADLTGLPVAPIFISGHLNMKLRDFFLRKRYIVVRFGVPLHFRHEKDPNKSVVDFYKDWAKRLRSDTSNLSSRPEISCS